MKYARFQAQLRKQRLDGALFIVGEVAESNLIYFTGLSGVSHAAFYIPASGKAVLYVSPLDYGGVVKKKGGFNVVQLEASLLKLLKEKYTFKRLGISYRSVPHGLYVRLKKAFPRVRFVDVDTVVDELRIVKTKKEIGALQKATSVADSAFRAIFRKFDFVSEGDVAAALDYEMKKRGGGIAFPTIVASGKNAAVPHHVPSTKLQKGFCVIDFGAVVNGYRSDCTRTIFIGKPTLDEIKRYQLVLKAQEKAIRAVNVGIVCGRLDAVARDALGDYKEYFTHSLGHGVGVDVHEAPGVGAGSKVKLRSGMVITIEPGIYVAGRFGIRIEDMVVVGKRKRVLTRLPKKLISVKRL